jgi:type I restriction enzyme, R subunit
MINEYAKYSSGYFDLIVVDEYHRSIHGEFRRALDHFDAIQIGLTATPLEGQLPEDADPEDRKFVRDTLRFFELDAPTFRYTLKEAIDDRWFVPCRIYRAQTVKTAASGGFAVKRDEIDWRILDARTREELEALLAEEDPLTVDPTALERRFTIPERNRAMVREFKSVLDNGRTCRDGIRRAPARGKTIVFAVNKGHAETLARMFDDAFAAEKGHPADSYAHFVARPTTTQPSTPKRCPPPAATMAGPPSTPRLASGQRARNAAWCDGEEGGRISGEAAPRKAPLFLMTPALSGATRQGRAAQPLTAPRVRPRTM